MEFREAIVELREAILELWEAIVELQEAIVELQEAIVELQETIVELQELKVASPPGKSRARGNHYVVNGTIDHGPCTKIPMYQLC